MSGRNNALTRIAGGLRRRGATEEEILSELLDHPEREGLPDSEVRSIARSVAGYESPVSSGSPSRPTGPTPTATRSNAPNPKGGAGETRKPPFDAKRWDEARAAWRRLVEAARSGDRSPWFAREIPPPPGMELHEAMEQVADLCGVVRWWDGPVGRERPGLAFPCREVSGELTGSVKIRFTEPPEEWPNVRKDGRTDPADKSKSYGHVRLIGAHRLPKYREEGDIVWVLAGEKDLLSGVLHGLSAVAVSGEGTKKLTIEEVEALARFRRVLVLYDRDEEGLRAARATVSDWRSRGIPAFFIPPDQAWPGKDLTDWLRAGVPIDAIGARARDHADVPLNTDIADAPSRNTSGGTADESEEWPEPSPLPDTLAPVEPFRPEMLPEVFRPWLTDAANRMQCPLDFLAVAAIVSFGAAVGRRCAIRPKCFDSWTVVPNLWGMIVGRPSVMKSPAMSEAMHPLERLEIEAGRGHEEAEKRFKLESELTEIRKKAVLKKLAGRPPALDALSPEDAAGLADQPIRPIRPRFIVNDTTVEKLGELLNENRYGVLQFRDELLGFLRSLERDGQESSRSFYLEAWKGDGRFTFDRIGRGTKVIEAATVSLLGSIQPDALRKYLDERDKSIGEDGLIQRFQLVVWPDPPREWTNRDVTPDRQARERAEEVFRAVVSLLAEERGATRDREDDIPYLRFSADAQTAFDEWREELEKRLLPGHEHPAMESHLAKYRSLIPSLALLFHLAEGGAGPVTERALRLALDWGRYLESHARRMYGALLDHGRTSGHALAKRIFDGSVPSPFGARFVYLKGWSELDQEGTEAAIEELTGLGWLRERTVPTDGRPRTEYHVNPAILAKVRAGGSGGTEAVLPSDADPLGASDSDSLGAT